MRRVFYKVISPIRKLYWFLFRPRTRGVKCVVKNNGDVLLIRNTYGKMHWTFPGGGVQRNETTDNAVKREVAEEVGIRIKKTIYLGEYYSNKEYKRDTVSCYLSSVANSEFTTDKSEIQEAGWFSINDLPRPASPAVERVLDLYRKKFN